MTHEHDAEQRTSDYLWDHSGSPDPEIQKLELALSRFRHNRVVPGFTEFAQPPKTNWWSIFAADTTPSRLAATTLLILTIGAASWLSIDPRPPSRRPTETGWQVQLAVQSSKNEHPKRNPVENSWLQLGQALETGTDTTATVAVAQIGRLELEPMSRLRLLQSRSGRQHVALDRGTIHATIWATPGQFVVDTPSAVAVDLGCMYTLHVDESGDGTLRTTLGWVGFHREGRESFIPAGAACATHPKSGPGTPYFEDASEAFRSALARFDLLGAESLERESALQVVVTQARTRDALTLWHLFSRTSAADRAAVYKRLAELVPPPTNVTRDGVLKLDRVMLDSWWNALDLGDISLWRHWERTWTSSPDESR